MQLDAGAIGLCCANIGEAEVMAHAGISDLLITSPLVTEAKIDRLCALVQQYSDIKVVVDNPENAQALSFAAVEASVALRVLVDVDPGLQRTGVSSHAAVIGLAKTISSLPNLQFMGLQCYCGHAQHVGDHEKRHELSHEAFDKLATIRHALTEEGLEPSIISGGGTGTHDIDAEAQVLTELQAGSYIFMDSQYNKVWSNERTLPPFESSLFVQTTVISSNQPGIATTDAGLKQFAVDGGEPVPVKGAPTGSTYHYFGDEFGRIELPNTSDSLILGARIECIVPHCDPTVNLYNVIHCFRGDTLIDIWPIDARGA
jgi:D-serine deaminase-like pyridoxal phosphate-dependent protein